MKLLPGRKHHGHSVLHLGMTHLVVLLLSGFEGQSRKGVGRQHLESRQDCVKGANLEMHKDRLDNPHHLRIPLDLPLPPHLLHARHVNLRSPLFAHSINGRSDCILLCL